MTRSRFRAHPESRIPNPVRLLAHWRKMFWLGVSAAVVMAGDVVLTKYGPSLRAAAVETGASFSVSAGSFPTQGKAATFAAALDSAGLPILVRVRPEDGRYQVLVGPYVSTEEAERAQRRLAAWGLGEARLIVDDTMRSRPQEAAVFGFGDSTSSSVVMVSAAGMSSVVFEMRGTPREVETRRASATAIDVTIDRGAAGTFELLWLPDGVSLVRELSIDDSAAGSLRAHLVVPEGVDSRLRLEGRRVYVDLAFTKAPWMVPTVRAPRPPRASTRVAAVESHDNYQEQLTAIVARITQLESFLVSAAEHPEPDVLAALSHSLTDVRATLEKTKAPVDQEGDRRTLQIALARASAALAPVFEGDRAAAVRDAIALSAAVTSR